MLNNKLEELVGTEIERIFIGEGEDRILFQTNKGTKGYLCYGDCCSETWIAEILGVDNLIGGTVIATESLELDDYNTEDGKTRQEVDSAYGEKITTNKGYTKIIYRNSSNGYYGGDLNFVEDLELGDNGKEITADFIA